MFSRGLKTTSALATATKTERSTSTDANSVDKTSLPSKFASGFQLGKLSSRTAHNTTCPTWLKDGCSVKQLPGIYQGVLGQVQLQPVLVNDSNKFTNGLDKLVNNQRRQQQANYMNRFTDTERVHQLLSTCRLSNEVLATIWAHVNKTFPGQLTNREVCLALALIALFQRLADNADKIQAPETLANNSDTIKQDPFSMVKLEKKPPVPKLYSNENPSQPPRRTSPTKTRIPTSNSMPNELGSSGLLIDIASDADDEPVAQSADQRTTELVYTCNNNAISLIDMDGSGGNEFEVNFARQTQVWLQFMTAMKNLYKRSFDILNVENCRSSALEALTTPKGVSFCKQLSVCYPIAHNITFKVNELKSVPVSDMSSKPRNLLDANYARQINDLMVSINEYWAVLINLFHESGLTDFIELIMDGLNRPTSHENAPLTSITCEQLKQDGRADICSICLTKFYLVNIGDALEVSAKWHEDDIELVFDIKLITQDNCFYYHPKCANFWLNHVPYSQGKLPFQSRRDHETDVDSTILKPISNHMQ